MRFKTDEASASSIEEAAEGKQRMATLLRMALWIVAGVLAVLAFTRFMFIEFDQNEDSDPSEAEGDRP